MGAVRHGNPGEWARVTGTVISLWPLFACFTALGALGASIFFGRNPAVFAGIFTACLLLTAALWRKGLRRVESFFKGARGEERVAGLLEMLPVGWHVFHDFEAGGYHVDHVAVGPTGVYAVETKNWRGRVTAEKGEVLVDGVLPDRAPLGQAAAEAKAVEAALRKAGCDVEAVPVLCMASDTFAGPASRVGGTVVVNASGVAAWVLGRPVVLSADRVARLAQLMETSV